MRCKNAGQPACVRRAKVKSSSHGIGRCGEMFLNVVTAGVVKGKRAQKGEESESGAQ